MGRELGWRDLEIVREPSGRPTSCCTAARSSTAKSRGVAEIHGQPFPYHRLRRGQCRYCWIAAKKHKDPRRKL
ncbi:MAG: hypothetical protein WDO13_02610 [Verrucomicrobiota bacterium]